MDKTWKDLPEKVQEVILMGSGTEKIKFTYQDGTRRYDVTKPFEGVIPNMDRRWRETDSSWVREDLARYQSETPCDACNGARLKPEALAVKIDAKNISEISRLSIKQAHQWFTEVEDKLSEKQLDIARRILKEIKDRLRFLNDVGLDYLNMSRNSGTLSGGESQRIRLASQIGSGLTGVLYVLDEPSIGLHQRDNDRLLISLKGLRDLGNSVLVVEHDEDAILQADYVIDMGPAAGVHGGEIIAQGAPEAIKSNPRSITGQYLTGKREIPLFYSKDTDQERRPINKEKDAEGHRRPRQQSEECHGRDPGRGHDLHHRRLRRRQINLYPGDPVQGGGATAEQRIRSPGRPRQDRRPGAFRQDRRDRPVADRPYAAVKPCHLYRRLRSDSRLVRRPA
ncbi:excinuclease ABC subunit A [Asticcacaulis biprosthecium C19]|uniref:UvrABC system protein A n=1 Tax=Asticcacaulis biprosthecium C19 TaxID=715226 RepID=F4QQ44_9CAUL|nr:excinuclease ABC subunit A [Asticcacaulis biprosthecium C19]